MVENKTVRAIIENKTIREIIKMALCIVIAIGLTALAMKVGPGTFDFFGYNITEPKIITASESTSFFLQALIAVVIGFLATKEK